MAVILGIVLYIIIRPYRNERKNYNKQWVRRKNWLVSLGFTILFAILFFIVTFSFSVFWNSLSDIIATLGKNKAFSEAIKKVEVSRSSLRGAYSAFSIMWLSTCIFVSILFYKLLEFLIDTIILLVKRRKQRKTPDSIDNQVFYALYTDDHKKISEIYPKLKNNLVTLYRNQWQQISCSLVLEGHYQEAKDVLTHYEQVQKKKKWQNPIGLYQR